jgi:hypothetical protein
MTSHHNPHKQRAPRRRSLRNASALASSVLLVAAVSILTLPSANAYAGDWMEVSCVNPNQSAATSEGWSSFTRGGPGVGSGAGTACAPGQAMYGLLSSEAPVGQGSAEVLRYTPPSGSTLAGGVIDVGMHATGYGGNARAVVALYEPNFEYNGNVFFQCIALSNVCAGGDNFTGEIALSPNRGGDLYLGAECGGETGQSCYQGASTSAWSLVELSWANLLLSNDATPAASGIGGTLLSPDARGTQELIFDASDTGGPGVYTVTVQIDGKTLYSGTPYNNDGKCVPVGSSDGTLMFDYSQPCRTSEMVDLPIETSVVADGQHTLKVTVEDAAQNTSVVYDGTISTQNAPANSSAPTITEPAELLAGTTLTAQPGAWSVPSGTGTIVYSYQWQDCNSEGANCKAIPGAHNTSYTLASGDAGHTLRVLVTASDNDGLSTAASTTTTTALPAPQSPVVTPPPSTPASPITNTPSTPAGGATQTAASTPADTGPGTPNGTPASETAQIRLSGPRTITRSYPQRAFTITGRLLDTQEHPIAGATLDVLEQIAGSGQPRLIAHARTHSDGTFTIHVPNGPSRAIQITYRAFANNSSYATQATISETVRASVKLTITPGHTSPTGTITLSGKVQGPIPHHGAIVELLVHYHGAWEPFRTPRTNPNGRFKVAYQFQGAIGHFPFRIQIPAGQTNFPYASGYSNTVNISTE